MAACRRAMSYSSKACVQAHIECDDRSLRPASYLERSLRLGRYENKQAVSTISKHGDSILRSTLFFNQISQKEFKDYINNLLPQKAYCVCQKDIYPKKEVSSLPSRRRLKAAEGGRFPGKYELCIHLSYAVMNCAPIFLLSVLSRSAASGQSVLYNQERSAPEM